MSDAKRAIGPFAALSLPGLKEIAAQGELRRFQRGDVIVRENASCDEFFVILAGAVLVYSRDETDREFIHERLGVGDFFGDITLDGDRHPTSVRARSATTCAVVTHRTLIQHCRSHPHFSAELIRVLIRRVRRGTRTTRALALHSIERRIIELLEDMATEIRGVRIIPERLTQREIAGYVGASREMVSKVLKEMVRSGQLDLRDQRIVLLRPRADPADKNSARSRR